MTNNHYTPETGEKAISEEIADMVSFGRLYITNPDLAERILNGWPLETKRKPEGPNGEGYNDYPFYKKM